MTDGESPRKALERQWTELLSVRSSWDSEWRDLADHFAPHLARFTPSDANRRQRGPVMVNNRPRFAARTLAAGMSGGLTSPARPWFRLTTADPDLAKYGPVMEWLHVAQVRLYQVLARSDVYRGLAELYHGLGVFGSPVLALEEDQQTVLRATTAPVGSFCLATGPSGRVETFAQGYAMLPRQLADEFGPEKLSAGLQAEAEKDARQQAARTVLHFVYRNREVVPGRRDAAGMPWRSCWLLLGGDSEPGFLRESGYWEWPVLAPRWARTGLDAYASSCPGMLALGDHRALQLVEKRSAQVGELLVRPPTRAPTSMRASDANLLPGSVTFGDGGPGNTFEAVYVPQVQALQYLGDERLRCEERVNEAFMVDLWLSMMRTEGGPAKTATEIAEMHSEKLMLLGPVLEGLNSEALDPLVHRTLGICDRLGLLPPPPRELGDLLTVKYTSILHEAQRLVDTAGQERIVAYAGQVATVAPEVVDVMDADLLVRAHAESVGLAPNLLRTEQQVQEIRAARRQAQQQAQAAAAVQQVAEGARTLAQADTSGDNALTRVASALGGQAEQLVPRRPAA